MKVGIVSYGIALPIYRLKIEEVCSVWGNAFPDVIKGSLNVSERAVLGPDDDVITLALEASKDALGRIKNAKLGGILFGTGSGPDDSRAASSVILDMLLADNHIFNADIKFSGKSGTAALIASCAMVASKMFDNILAIGTDTINRHISPGDLQESYSGAGAGAIVVGTKDLIAEIEGFASYTTDLADDFRIQGERYIKTGMNLGSEKNSVGIYDHVEKSVMKLFEKNSLKAEDFDYVVFPQPYGSMPASLAKKLGFEKSKIEFAQYAETVGNAGAASPFIGLSKVLDKASANQRILLVSYGFGAGSDAIALKTTEDISKNRVINTYVESKLENKIYIDYATAIKYEYKYLRSENLSSAFI